MTSIIFTTEWTGGRQAERQKSMQLEYDLYNGLKVPSIFYWINDDIHDAVHQSECLREPREWEVIFFFLPSSFILFFFTILSLSAPLVPLVVDDTGGAQQQGQRQAHEADPAQHAGQ